MFDNIDIVNNNCERLSRSYISNVKQYNNIKPLSVAKHNVILLLTEVYISINCVFILYIDVNLQHLQFYSRVAADSFV